MAKAKTPEPSRVVSSHKGNKLKISTKLIKVRRSSWVNETYGKPCNCKDCEKEIPLGADVQRETVKNYGYCLYFCPEHSQEEIDESIRVSFDSNERGSEKPEEFIPALEYGIRGY